MIPLVPADAFKQMFRVTFDILWALKWYILPLIAIEVVLPIALKRILQNKMSRDIFIASNIILLIIFIYWVYH